MAGLTALAALFDRGPGALLRVSIVTALAIHVAGTLVLRHVISRLSNAEWGWTAAACWLISPLAFLLAVQATEAALYGLALLVALACHVTLLNALDARRLPGRDAVVRYGLALGAVSLARTDGLLVTALAVLWLAAATLRISRDVVRAAGIAGGAALAAALVNLPWWLLSVSQVGTVVQDSGAMKVLWAADLYPTLAARLWNLWRTTDYFVRVCLSVMTVWNFSWVTCALGIGAAALGPLVVLRAEPRRIVARALRSVCGVAGLMLVVYGLTLTDRQLWWLVLPSLTFTVILFSSLPAAARICSVPARWQHWTRVVLVLLALTLFARWHIKAPRPYPWQPDVLASQRSVEALVPPAERIGCFNAGIPAYFGSRTIVPLDGLVDHDVRRLWYARRFDEVLRVSRVRYIADEERAMARAMRFAPAPLPLQELASFPLRGWPGGRRVVWRVDQGTARDAGEAAPGADRVPR
jgi:hypothetical protein